VLELLAIPVRQSDPITPLAWVLWGIAVLGVIAFTIRHYRNKE